MRLERTLALSLLGVCMGGGIGAQCRPADGYSDLRAALQRSGADPDAQGQAWSTLSTWIAQLRVDVANLAAATTYEIVVDDTPKLSFQTDAQGRATIVLGDDAGPALDFDPRGRELEIRRGGDDVLRVAMVSTGATANPGSELAALTRTEVAASGRAVAKYFARPDGRRRFSVEVQQAPAGPYALFVNGTQRGTIAAPSGFGEIEFDSVQDDSPSGELLLDFDPAGAQIDLLLGGAVAFTGSLQAGVGGVNVCEPLEILRPLAGAGEAKARFRVRDDCDRDFEVEIEDVAAGSYPVRVGGVDVGTLVAAFDPARGKVRGELEFDSDDDDPEELPLGFDPRGQSVEILSGAQVVASIASFEAGPGVPQVCAEEETRNDLFAGSAQPAASGDARLRVRDDCRSDLSVEIEDVTPGAYDVLVAGTVRGTISAAFDPVAGQVRGEIEFGDDDPGSPALDFDARGQRIDIVQGAVVVLSTTFVGGGLAGGASCVDDRETLALLNLAAPAQATATARHRVRDDCRRSFTVELEDVVPGSYTLLVDGAPEGVLTVGALGQGELELDTNDAPKPVLTFDPRGREIAIAQGAVVLFAHDFPAE